MRGLIAAALLLAAAAETPLRWLMLGDWGISGYNQAYVANVMGNYANTYSPSFVIALGDNFYTNGVQSTSDSQWSGSWSSVYLGYSGLNVPWYPVLVSTQLPYGERSSGHFSAHLYPHTSPHVPIYAPLCPAAPPPPPTPPTPPPTPPPAPAPVDQGNHDWGMGFQGALAQVQYSSVSSYWTMPSTNYSVTHDLPGGGTVAFVFVETCRLAASESKACNYKVPRRVALCPGASLWTLMPLHLHK